MLTEKIFKIIKRKFQLSSIKDATGFTLIEVIAAIGVVSIGFVGSLVVLSKASSQAAAIKDRVVAVHLAAEGVEVIRNIRDSNWLQPNPWLHNIVLPNNKEVTAIVDYDTDNVYKNIDTSDLTENRECLNWDGSFYKHAVALNNYACSTSFRRRIFLIEKKDSDNVSYLEIKSRVRWKEKGISRELIVIDHLYDWE
jgi:prepilin-type N-terminal cleavage/methylation domain-containing protein